MEVRMVSVPDERSGWFFGRTMGSFEQKIGFRPVDSHINYWE
jgi:hypothetical protein